MNQSENYVLIGLLYVAASRPHIEWLTAYRKAKENAEKTSGPDEITSSGANVPMFNYPPNGMPSSHPGSAFNLRNLLGNKNDNQHSASGFLRSIVQAVMQQGTAPGQGASSTSIYASLVDKEETSSIQGQPVDSPPYTEPSPTPGDELPTGEIKRKGSKRKATGSSSPAVIAKYPATERERRNSLSSNSASESGDVLLPRESHEQFSPSLISTASRSNTSSPISVGGDVMPPQSLISDKWGHQPVDPCKYPQPEPIRSQYNSPSDYQRTSISPELSWSDTESEHTKTFMDRRSKLAPRRQSLSSDSDISTVSSVSKHHNSSQIKDSLHVGSSLDIVSSPVYQFPIPDDRLSANSRIYPGEISKYNFTNMEKQSEKSYEKNNDDFLRDCEEETLKEMIYCHRGVQCELLIRPQGTIEGARPRYVTDDGTASSSGDESVEGMVMSESRKGVKGCEHCGISFDDEVLHSIHMGCHSHTDPFSCNVCGRACGNRYGFYTHIMRGHHP